MNEAQTDRQFTGSIPELYDTHMVPLIFEPYAQDLALRLAALAPERVLEIAAGTGVVTRAMARALPERTAIVATDLNQAMLDHASARGTARAVEWRQADAMRLPWEDGSFDAVVCQFGVMFFPDKAKAFAEARRVLAPGGSFLFSVWDRIEENDIADTVTTALAGLFPDDPPRFMARTPHGYHDRAQIERELVAGGFTEPPAFTTLAARSRAASCDLAAQAYCQGTPLRGEIEARAATGLAAATEAAARALRERFGEGVVDGKIQALIVATRRAD